MNYKIYTSYFGNAKNFDTDKYALIGIAGRSPEGWKGLEYKKLAASWSIWNDYHLSMINSEQAKNREAAKKSACTAYTNRFKDEILGNFDAVEVVKNIFKLADGKTPVLLCYEKPEDFCHRHLVAEWLNANNDVFERFVGFSVCEWHNGKEEQVLF